MTIWSAYQNAKEWCALGSDIQMHNLMEDLVASKLDDLMAQANACCCNRCKADILALTLNNLPPRYVVCICGDIFTRFDSTRLQSQADITAKILWAISVVQSNPHHDDAKVGLQVF